MFRDQLEQVLPDKIGVSRGFVVDSTGKVSNQMDIILYDRLNTPRIFTSVGAQTFPVESTYACGEVKTKLNSSTLGDSFDKCLSYKKLSRKAYFARSGPTEMTHNLFGHKSDHWQSIFFCIAVEMIKAKCLSDTYNNIIKERDLHVHERVDTVMALSGTDGNMELLSKVVFWQLIQAAA